MYRLIRAILFLLPEEAAHRLGIWTLRWLGRSSAVAQWTRRRALDEQSDLGSQIAGLTFPNPIGLAAGLDKNAEAIPGLFALGFGAVEVGTVTPRPQAGNPSPRLFRLPSHQALINRMGFNNCGAEEAAQRLASLRWKPGPVGVNIGKNKDTPLERAVDDYLQCVDRLTTVSDYLVVNVSSPNTPDLRQLQDPDRLPQLLDAVQTRLARIGSKPLFVKIAPDLDDSALDQIVDIALAHQVSGIIATNTTLERPFSHPLAKEAGGLSGAPLRGIATRVIRRLYGRARGRLAIIGVGGVFSAEDAYEKMRAGANGVQIYTGLIYQGPAVVGRILRGLRQLLARDGFRSLSEAVGRESR
jgi:dihydroorotate dehydrogenase